MSFYGDIRDNVQVDAILRSYFPDYTYHGVFLNIGDIETNSRHFLENGWHVYHSNTDITGKIDIMSLVMDENIHFFKGNNSLPSVIMIKNGTSVCAQYLQPFGYRLDQQINEYQYYVHGTYHIPMIAEQHARNPIINVKYGGKTVFIDVTDIIFKIILVGTRVCVVSNTIFEDPVYGVHKHLIIKFTNGLQYKYPERCTFLVNP